MRRWVALVGILAACGRVGFDRVARDDAGDVTLTGCADGTREGFFDLQSFPTIAACRATWAGTRSMRAAKTGIACGDDLGACGVPADACANGWHVCANLGVLSDLSSRIAASDCASAGGATTGSFVAASAHCAGCLGTCMLGESECTYAASYGCGGPTACNEPVCCGPDCYTGQNCKGGAFPAPGTRVGTVFQPCGALPGDTQTGVLCCAD